MRIKAFFLKVFLTGIFFIPSISYSKDNFFKDTRFEVSLIIEAIDLPSWKLFKTPLHFGLYAGTSTPLTQKSDWNTNWINGIGFFHHAHIQNGLFFKTQYEVAYNVYDMNQLAFQIGTGYFHNFQDAPVYAPRNGGVERIMDWGKPEMIVPLGLSYRQKISSHYFQYTYELMPELFAAPKMGIFAFPHIMQYFGWRSYE